jgi:S1-C subfamily serine protease
MLETVRPVTTIVGLLATLAFSFSSVQAADISAGSGVVIGTHGEILTNSHVLEECAEITIRFPSGKIGAARLVARDERNDLAVVRATAADIPSSSVATFRGVRLFALVTQ